MHSFKQHIRQNWPIELKVDLSYTIALSGGVDSISLLHLFAALRDDIPGFRLRAVHINHGISPNADTWAKFCADICSKLDVKLITSNHKVNKAGGESLENNARCLRYQLFDTLDTDVIILAHHQNDQIETALSQIMRGSNPHNVAAMKPITLINGKYYWRPLLNSSRADIEEYATTNQLLHIDDESNSDKKFLRNFIRHDILPKLLAWDSSIFQKIPAFIDALQQDMALIDEIALLDLVEVSTNNQLDLAKFKMLSNLRQINLISHFILQNNLPLPSTRQISEFVKQAVTSKHERKPLLKLTSAANIIKEKSSIFIRLVTT